MSDEKEFDVRYTDAITCPHCGHAQSDSWEYGVEESGRAVECGECEKEFYCSASISITYVSEFLKEGAGKK